MSGRVEAAATRWTQSPTRDAFPPGRREPYLGGAARTQRLPGPVSARGDETRPSKQRTMVVVSLVARASDPVQPRA